MNKKIKVGRIQKSPTAVAVVTPTIIKQVKKMKIGEFFEVTGIDTKDVQDLRSSLCYYAKKESFKVKTKRFSDTLTISRIRK